MYSRGITSLALAHVGVFIAPRSCEIFLMPTIGHLATVRLDTAQATRATTPLGRARPSDLSTITPQDAPTKIRAGPDHEAVRGAGAPTAEESVESRDGSVRASSGRARTGP
jgi:hypothetical protein